MTYYKYVGKDYLREAGVESLVRARVSFGRVQESLELQKSLRYKGCI